MKLYVYFSERPYSLRPGPYSLRHGPYSLRHGPYILLSGPYTLPTYLFLVFTCIFSPQGGQTNGDGRIIEENLEVINKFNREAKINPDNSVLVEVSLTAEQFELVKSGRYIVSLCDTMAMDQTINDPKLNLTNWKAKPAEPPAYNESYKDHPTYAPERAQSTSRTSYGGTVNNNAHRDMKPNIVTSSQNMVTRTNVIPIQQKQNMSHPFSPLSSESSGIGGHSYSPPTHQPMRNEPIMNTVSFYFIGGLKIQHFACDRDFSTNANLRIKHAVNYPNHPQWLQN